MIADVDVTNGDKCPRGWKRISQLVELLVMMMDAILLNSQLTKFLSRVYHKSTTDVFHPKTILFMPCMLMKLMAFQESIFGHINRQCWASYFVKVTSYILLATELFSYSYILPIK